MLSWVNTFQNFAAACRPGRGGVPDFLLPTWYKYLDGVQENGACSVVFVFPDDLGKVAVALVEMLLRLAGAIAVGFVIYGGFRYILSQGSPDGTKAARETIINAMIGLIIAIIASTLVAFVARVLTS
jgi:hypothetical protein